MLMGMMRCPFDLCRPSVFDFVLNAAEFFRPLLSSSEAVWVGDSGKQDLLMNFFLEFGDPAPVWKKWSKSLSPH